MLTIKKKYGRKVSYNNFEHNKSYIAWSTTQKFPSVSVIFLDITCSKGIFLALSYRQWPNIPITTHAAKLVNIRRTHLSPRAQDQQSLETTEAYHTRTVTACTVQANSQSWVLTQSSKSKLELLGRSRPPQKYRYTSKLPLPHQFGGKSHAAPASPLWPLREIIGRYENGLSFATPSAS